MQKFGVFKKYFMVFGFLVALGLGAVSFNVMTSCESGAQVCGNSACSYTANDCIYFGGMTIPLTTYVTGSVIPDMGIVTGYLTAYFIFAMNVGWQLAVGEKILEVTRNQIGWWDTFWYYNLRPAMMDMTDQLVTMDKHQDVQLAKFQDVINLNRSNREMMRQEINSHRELRPGELICQVASAGAGGMNRAAVFQRQYAAAAGTKAVARSGNAVGTPGAQGNAASHRVRWGNFVAQYCDPNENGGYNGCPPGPPPPNANRDLNVTGEIFEKDTINVKDPATNQVVEDLIENIAEPRVREPIPQGSVTNGGQKGQQQVLMGESYKAKRAAVQDALRFVLARKVPGSKTGEFLEQMRGMNPGGSGVTPAYLAPNQNPSKNEIMQVMMDERFRTGEYSVDQVDNPDNNGRELVVQAAFQAMQLSDQIDLTDRFAVLLAAEISHSVRGSKSLLEDTDDRPKR